MKWDYEAIEVLQSLERYTTLKAVEEAKSLVKKVTEFVHGTVKGDESVTKQKVQSAIMEVMKQMDEVRNSG